MQRPCSSPKGQLRPRPLPAPAAQQPAAHPPRGPTHTADGVDTGAQSPGHPHPCAPLFEGQASRSPQDPILGQGPVTRLQRRGSGAQARPRPLALLPRRPHPTPPPAPRPRGASRHPPWKASSCFCMTPSPTLRSVSSAFSITASPDPLGRPGPPSSPGKSFLAAGSASPAASRR